MQQKALRDQQSQQMTMVFMNSQLHQTELLHALIKKLNEK